MPLGPEAATGMAAPAPVVPAVAVAADISPGRAAKKPKQVAAGVDAVRVTPAASAAPAPAAATAAAVEQAVYGNAPGTASNGNIQEQSNTTVLAPGNAAGTMMAAASEPATVFNTGADGAQGAMPASIPVANVLPLAVSDIDMMAADGAADVALPSVKMCST